jgi:HAD superfamily hydrolase (TIGR01549 family)
MGGDQIVAALIGEEAEAEDGDAIREMESEAYGELIDEVDAMRGAGELLEDLSEEDATVVLASSAKEGEVERYLDLLDARDLVSAWTTSADVERTKPAPDLVRAALDKAEGDGPRLMIGDSVWDVRSASAAGVPTLAVLTGGFSDAELREAGAAEVVRSIEEIRRDRRALFALAR